MASTDALPIPRKNIAYRVIFPIMKSDGTIITSWAGAAATISKDQASSGSATNTPTEIATTWGIGYLDLTSAEMNCDCLAVKITVTNTGAVTTTLVLYPMEDVDIRSNVVDWSGSAVNGLISGKVDSVNSMVSGTASAGAANSITLTGASATDNLYKYSLVQIVGGTGAGQVRVILDYVGSTKVATVGKAWTTTPDNTSVYVVIPFAEPEIVHAGIAQTGAASTITLQSVASATDNVFNGDVIVLIGGTGSLQSRVITAYNGTTKVATVDQAWVTTPDSTSIYKVMSFGRGWSDVFMWNGTAVSSPATAGIPDVNTKNINNVSASSVTTVNANVGTTQPENFTGTAASALVKVDVTDIATAAVSTGTAQLGVNVVNIGGGASQGAAGYVGTDQSKITNPTATVDLSGTTIKNVDNAIANVTLVATTTNLTNAPTNGDFTAAMKTSLNAATPSVTVSDKTGFSLSALGIQAIWDALTSALTTVGSIGKLLVTNLDATISSRTKPADTQARVTLVDTATLTTTATNLTNAPTSGDFTATMKTSLNNSTPTSVTTVTGNVNGNVTGSVGSVLGNVAGSVASVVGNVGGNIGGSIGSLATQAKTDVAGAVLNAVAASYNVAGSIGALINTISSIDVSGIPAAVWNYLVSSLGTTTTVGGWFNSLLVAIKAKTDTLGAATIQVRSVTTDAGTIYLTAGDDYLAVDGRSLDFTFSGMPSFVGATCRMSFASGSGYLIAAPVAGTVLSASSLRFEPTHTVTATLTQAANFEIEVTLADGSIITPIPLKDGKAVIAQQAG